MPSTNWKSRRIWIDKGCVLLTFLLLMLAAPAVTGSEWEVIGPDGGSVNRIDRIDNVLWASTPAGLFRSADSGRSWERSGRVDQFTITWGVTKAWSILYAATDAGIWRSDDEGISWRSALDSGVYMSNVRDIEVHRGRLLACTWIGSIHASDDSGRTWKSTQPDSGGAFVLDLFTLDTVLYAGTMNGVYVSYNAGRNFRKKTSGTCYGFTLFDGVMIAWSNPAQRSIDSGRTWSYLPIEDARSAAASEDGTWILTSIYLNGIWRSRDKGATWTRIAASTLGTTAEAVQTIGHRFVLNPYALGCFRSDDDGDTWIPSTDGLKAVRTYGISAAHDALYLGSEDHGLQRSTNSGTTWTQMFGSASVNDVTARDGRVLLGYQVPGRASLSVDSGRYFVEIKRLSGQYEFIESTFLDKADLYVGSGRSLSRSTDNGRTWVGAGSGLPEAYVYCMAFNDTSVFCGTITTYHGKYGGVFRSTDHGESWVQCDIPNTSTNDDVWSMIANGATVIAGTSRGMFRSTDDGITWTKVAAFSPNGLIRHRNVYFGSTGFGLIYSDNDGLSWTFLQPYIPGAAVRSVAAIDNEVFIGLEYGGAMRRTIDFVPLDVDDDREHDPRRPLHIYPNPVNGTSFTIGATGLEGSTVRLLDLSGSTIHKSRLGASATVGLTDVTSGVYLCVVDAPDGSTRVQIMAVQR